MDLPAPARVTPRDPNAVTAPPLHRGSMVPRPWRGFWNSLGTALLAQLNGGRGLRAAVATPAPWERAARRRRLALGGLTLTWSLLAGALFVHLQPEHGPLGLRALQAALFVLLSAWVLVGFVTALMGFWVSLRGDRHSLSAASVREHPMNPQARTALVMPICHEDVGTVFAGLRATCESLAGTGQAAAFDVFVLSDSHDPQTLRAEREAWARLREELAAAGGGRPAVEVYYRARRRRTHRKAGNVADFCRRWGKDYRYFVVLDADSVMSGACLVDMVKLMEANPRAGIIQTATQAIGHPTLHARAQQFAARVTGRLFTLGMQYWQLGESHYWGHNAILRTEAFMRHCALAPLKGLDAARASILSHDFVEAALMRRGGYHVWLVSDLQGSYEQQPPDLLSELQRDRRWCQGNLQNLRLIAEPGLHRVHRTLLGVGAFSYLAAPLWLAFLAVGTALGALSPADDGIGTWLAPQGLWIWTLGLLFLPRVLGVLAVWHKGRARAFGGPGLLLLGSLVEAVLATLQAPLRLLAHTLFVLTALTGWRLEWRSPPRAAQGLAWADTTQRLAPTMLIAAAVLATLTAWDVGTVPGLLPVLLPCLLAVPLAVGTGHVALGHWVRAQGLLRVPEEAWSPAVLRRAWRHASRWSLQAA